MPLNAFDRVLETLVGFGRIVQQGENFLRVFLRKPNDRLALDHALRFHIRRLHDELVDGRAQKLRRLFQRVTRTLSETRAVIRLRGSSITCSMPVHGATLSPDCQ